MSPHDLRCQTRFRVPRGCTCSPVRVPYREPVRQAPLTSLLQTKHASDCLAAGNSSFACTCDPTEENLLVQASRPSPAELIRRAKQRGLFKARNVYSF